MKKRYAYRDGKMVELTSAQEVRHPDVWARLLDEGTAGERQMQGYKEWESEHGLTGCDHSASTIKEAWARDLRDNYGSQSDFRAQQAAYNEE